MSNETQACEPQQSEPLTSEPQAIVGGGCETLEPPVTKDEANGDPK